MELLSKKQQAIEEKIRLKKIEKNFLEKDLGFTLNPFEFFSSERTAKKAELDYLQRDLFGLDSDNQNIAQQIVNTADLSRRKKEELTRYNDVDRLGVEAKARAIEVQLDGLVGTLDEVTRLKDQVDLALRELLTEMNESQQQRVGLCSDILNAENLERELSSASNGFERKQVHEKCQNRFKDGSPSNILRSKHKELDQVDRKIAKLDSRLKAKARIASRTVKTIVIDGSNLCYQNKTFIGLAPLLASVPVLANTYLIILVFDASIKRLLGVSDQEIRMQFKELAAVHIVRTKAAADDTILDAATNSDAYVISNDRYHDYPDKSAVHERRLITHEILNDRILIQDLDLNEEFEVVSPD